MIGCSSSAAWLELYSVEWDVVIQGGFGNVYILNDSTILYPNDCKRSANVRQQVSR